jgi:hypothetical protein
MYVNQVLCMYLDPAWDCGFVYVCVVDFYSLTRLYYLVTLWTSCSLSLLYERVFNVLFLLSRTLSTTLVLIVIELESFAPWI